MTKFARCLFAAVAACALSACAESPWPLVVVRQQEEIDDHPEKLKAILEAHRRHPGSCDEMWMADRDFFRTRAQLKHHLDAINACRADFERAGVKIAFQQGYDIGHWQAGDEKIIRSEFPEGADIFQRDRNGDEIVGILCPRSPDVLAWETEYAETVGRALDPASYWIDDDLRMGTFGKRDACFCDRCLAAFNAETKQNLTRAEIVRRLFDGDCARDPIRRQWMDFNAGSLAAFAAAARKGMDRVGPAHRMGYESVNAGLTYMGWDYAPILKTLAGSVGTAGIRPGAGFYTEESPREMVFKSMDVAREAERCRRMGFVGSICYEEENFQRIVLNKSPGTMVVEAALGLASGCDSVSLYFNDERFPEPAEEYERFAKTVAEARPYFAALAEASRRTHLAGLSRFVGSAAAETPGFDIRDPAIRVWAVSGIPISVMEAGYPLWYVNEKSRREMTAEDERKAAGHVVELPNRKLGYPTQAERLQLLDAIDRVTEGRFPVRVDACRPLRILPRITSDGKLDSVTFLNCSVGRTDALKVRVRNPAGTKPVWRRLYEQPVELKSVAESGESVLVVPSLPGWEIGTVFFR